MQAYAPSDYSISELTNKNSQRVFLKTFQLSVLKVSNII